MTGTSHADAGDDLRAIVQLVLNNPKLTQYYHFDVRPERLPLAIANRTGVALDPTGMTADGHPVRGSDDAKPDDAKPDDAKPDDGKSLVITAFAVAGDDAEIAFTYRAEGVAASGRFKKIKGQWKTETLSVAERS